MGFYPVTPAGTQYVIGTPLFKKAEINFENGKNLTIDAPQNNTKNKYVQSIIINGKLHTKNYFDHFELQKGGDIKIIMNAIPNKARGIGIASYPFSMSTNN